MVMSMYVDADGDRAHDQRLLEVAIEQSLLAGEHGFNPWYTEHHFRGPWHSAPMQFAAFIAPQLPDDRYVGFGVLSVPFYHPVRLVEQMNLLDQLTRGKALFGLGSVRHRAVSGSRCQADHALAIRREAATDDHPHRPNRPRHGAGRPSRLTGLPRELRCRSEDAGTALPALVDRGRAPGRGAQGVPTLVHGPAIASGNGGPTPAQFVAGGDMTRVIAGSPETVAGEVQTLAVLGINHLLVRFLGEWHGETRWIAEQSMRLFSEHVMPAFDARGYGDSSWSPTRDYSIDAQLADIAAVADHLRWDRPVLLGHSRGGSLAPRFTAHFPERVGALVLADSRPGRTVAGPARTPSAPPRAQGPVPDPAPTVFPTLADALAATSRDPSSLQRPTSRARLERLFTRTDDGYVLAGVRRAVAAPPARSVSPGRRGGARLRPRHRRNRPGPGATARRALRPAPARPRSSRPTRG
jgi:pimeloyl-ACP methyl ester carboxylesterase